MQKQKFEKIKKRGLLAILVAAVLGILIPSATSYAYWPDREFLTDDNPTEYPVLNSLCYGSVGEDKKSCKEDSDSKVGREFDFVRVRELGTEEWGNEVKVEAEKEYEVWIYYHVNTPKDYSPGNIEANKEGKILSLRVYSNFDRTTTKQQKAKVTSNLAWLSPKGGTPAAPFPTGVWDEAYFATDSEQKIMLNYVADSAKYFKANCNSNCSELTLEGDGIPIPEEFQNYNEDHDKNGYGLRPELDNDERGVVIYRVRAERADSTIEKFVSRDGESWAKELAIVKAGESIQYKIEWCNTGTVSQQNVIFKDKLPIGLVLKSGTVKIAKENEDAIDESDAIIKNGINVGDFSPGQCVQISYEVAVSTNLAKLVDCTTTELKNTAFVYGDSVQGEDSARLLVNIACELPKTGPGETALMLVAVICVSVGATYWWRSQRDLDKAKRAASSGDEPKNDKDK